jgi:hypothetical protein
MTPPPSDATPPDPVSADPMLRVLRERHPEVDIVVLPQPLPVEAPVLDDAQRLALSADLDRSLDELLARVVPDEASTSVAQDVGWHSDEWGLTWYERTAVVGPLARGDNMTLLRATAHALVDLGWQARPLPGDRPRLAGRRRGGLEAAATVRPESLVLTLRTAKVRPTQEVAS